MTKINKQKTEKTGFIRYIIRAKTIKSRQQEFLTQSKQQTNCQKNDDPMNLFNQGNTLEKR